MKTFKSFLNASQAEDRNQFHIIIKADETEIQNIEQGQWLHSGIIDYWQWIEKPNPDNTQVHIHIARQKHVNTKAKHITWHMSGPKHDKQAFNDNLNGLTTATNIAKAVLKLPADKVLELIANKNAETLLSPIYYLPNKCKIFVFKIADTK